jgi:hypothetical protein
MQEAAAKERLRQLAHAADYEDGQQRYARHINGRPEGHGRIAGRCQHLQPRITRQRLVILLMAFAPSRKP